jgi:mono/diheme cytochrome c family protein
MRRLAAVLMLSSLSAAPRPALAWDDAGHKIVALIADHYMAPATRDKVHAMLASDPDTLTLHDIASEATWADKYAESDKTGSKERYNQTRRWHFADIDAVRPNIPAACFGQKDLPAGVAASKGPAEDCVIDKVSQFTDELANPKTDPDERRIALKFLLNLVGDIHQPLRVANESNNFGMMIQVSASSVTPGDLFDYWDIAFVDALGPDPVKVADQLIAKITDDERLQWASAAPQLWALEAHQIGVDKAYGMLDTVDPKGMFALSDAAVTKAVGIEGTQLSRAGVRLAYILDTAFGAAAPPLPAVAQGDAAAGHDFAIATCAVCHSAAFDQPSPKAYTNAPDFGAIANTRGMTPAALHAFLYGPHPTMPALVLTEKQADDVIAYIVSKRKR